MASQPIRNPDFSVSIPFKVNRALARKIMARGDLRGRPPKAPPSQRGVGEDPQPSSGRPAEPPADPRR
jgi:hypothetical protein